MAITGVYLWDTGLLTHHTRRDIVRLNSSPGFAAIMKALLILSMVIWSMCSGYIYNQKLLSIRCTAGTVRIRAHSGHDSAINERQRLYESLKADQAKPKYPVTDEIDAMVAVGKLVAKLWWNYTQ
jgi:hypothetical protein